MLECSDCDFVGVFAHTNRRLLWIVYGRTRIGYLRGVEMWGIRREHTGLSVLYRMMWRVFDTVCFGGRPSTDQFGGRLLSLLRVLIFGSKVKEGGIWKW